LPPATPSAPPPAAPPPSLLVSLSAFLVIGATSALTYNIASHAKTVLIILGGVALFGDAAHPAKLLGVVLAMLGIVVYSTRA
jgi:multidrug transporter EmrE-like cation transporter